MRTLREWLATIFIMFAFVLGKMMIGFALLLIWIAKKIEGE